jgi:hypothetical protein
MDHLAAGVVFGNVGLALLRTMSCRGKKPPGNPVLFVAKEMAQYDITKG